MALIIKALILSLFTCQLFAAAPGWNRTLNKAVMQDTSKPVLYLYVDELPQFRGGSDSLNKFVGENLRWPQGDICFEGTIMTSFVIEKDGTVNNINAISGHFPSFEKEAIQLISKMPSWIPGKVRGRPVRTLIYFPVRFRLEE